MIPKYFVIRLNHRKKRDKRLTTHIALISRAFKSSGFIYTGEKDEKLENSIRNVVNNWKTSIDFEIIFWEDLFSKLRNLLFSNSFLVHLTMYGDPIQDYQKKIFEEFEVRKRNAFFIVGGSKVPNEVYKLSEFNLAVTSQPHSEAGALAVALDRCFPDSINN